MWSPSFEERGLENRHSIKLQLRHDGRAKISRRRTKISALCQCRVIKCRGRVKLTPRDAGAPKAFHRPSSSPVMSKTFYGVISRSAGEQNLTRLVSGNLLITKVCKLRGESQTLCKPPNLKLRRDKDPPSRKATEGKGRETAFIPSIARDK